MSDDDLIKREDVVFLLDTFIAEYGKALIAELGDTEEPMSTKELASFVTDIVVDILAAVKVIPPVDAKPVARGEWSRVIAPIEMYWCSECKGVAGKRSNFCLNCGADMRREVNDEP